jgi:hypothetical protein
MTEFRQRIRHPELLQLYDYWDKRRTGRRFPARADIDPLDLKFALGNLTLVDVLQDPLRFRFRLTGSLFAQRMGLDLAGKFVDDIPDAEYRARVHANFARMAETGEPSISLNERVIDGERHKFEVLRLPLSEDGVKVTMLLTCAMYFERPPAQPALGRNAARNFEPPKPIDE